MRRIFYFVLLLLVPVRLNAASEQYAVVRIPSHGASATVIDTGPGYSWLLGCGHAYSGSDRTKPMVIDVARIVAAPAKQVGSRLEFIDYEADLSLVLLYEGPLDYVARVAPIGHDVTGHTFLSVGFDEMKFPVTQKPATILRDDSGSWWTREMPWHGRSGGALLDTTSGYLIGVVQGYTCPYSKYRPISHHYDPNCQGIYVDLSTIQSFLNRYRGAPSTPQPKLSSPQPLTPCPGSR